MVFPLNIYLLNFVNPSSKIVLEHISHQNSSRLLDFNIDDDDTCDKTMPGEPHHEVYLNQVISENNTASDVIKIISKVNISVYIQESIFKNNQAEESATSQSLVSIRTPEGMIQLTESRFVDNMGYLGSTIRLSSPHFQNLKTIIVRCNFTRNTGANLGGALLIQASVIDLYFNECKFIGNIANLVGGAVTVEPLHVLGGKTHEATESDKQSNDINITVSHSIFKSNQASYYGGAIMFNRMKGQLHFKLESVVFQNNLVHKGGGGAIAILGTGRTSALFINSNFLSNTVKVTLSKYNIYGGSVLLINQSIDTLIIEGCIISDNVIVDGHTKGGMISIIHSIMGSFILRNVTMSSNRGSGQYAGGAVLDIRTVSGTSPNISLLVENCTVFNNTGQTSPGFLILDASYSRHPGVVLVSLINTTIANNKVEGKFVEPGAIHILIKELPPYLEY